MTVEKPDREITSAKATGMLAGTIPIYTDEAIPPGNIVILAVDAAGNIVSQTMAALATTDDQQPMLVVNSIHAATKTS